MASFALHYAKKLQVHICAASAQLRTQITVIIFLACHHLRGALAFCAPPKHATASHKANARSERRDEERMMTIALYWLLGQSRRMKQV
jgi:hypothetical protein